MQCMCCTRQLWKVQIPLKSARAVVEDDSWEDSVANDPRTNQTTNRIFIPYTRIWHLIQGKCSSVVGPTLDLCLYCGMNSYMNVCITNQRCPPESLWSERAISASYTTCKKELHLCQHMHKNVNDNTPIQHRLYTISSSYKSMSRWDDYLFPISLLVKVTSNIDSINCSYLLYSYYYTI